MNQEDDDCSWRLFTSEDMIDGEEHSARSSGNKKKTRANQYIPEDADPDNLSDRDYLSMKDYYAYRFQIRQNEGINGNPVISHLELHIKF
ncbi:hypothetical protein ACET3Z_017804 [Daucus carota]